MKITFVVANPNMTGGIKVCAIYAQRLIQLGHEVTIVTPKKRLLNIKKQIKRILKGKGWLSKKEQIKNHFELLGVKVKYADEFSPLKNDSIPDADIIIATWWETAEWVNTFSKNKGEKVYFIQGHEIFSGLPIERSKATYQMPFQQITIATWLVKILEQDYGSSDVYLVPNSVDLNQFYANKRQKQDLPTIGFLFSELEIKGVDTSLKVVENLRRKIPAFRVIAFGEKPPETIKLPEYVELSINPKQEDLRLLYQKCDVWLCCSLIEGFGLTILEAMACRTPAVSTKCGGPEDIIIENKNGYLCDVNDVQALSDAALKVLTCSNEEWLRLSENAYQHTIKYTWDDAAASFENILLKTIQSTSV